MLSMSVRMAKKECVILAIIEDPVLISRRGQNWLVRCD